MKRDSLFLLIYVLFATLFFSSLVLADNHEGDFSDAQLEATAGIEPDSFFYFLDKFFDRLGDDLTVREEKIAEIRAMIREGNIVAAHRALERYYLIADLLEEEIDPERVEDARRSAAAIRHALEEIEDEIPDEERVAFFDDILNQEDILVTAAEIASKIKELCKTLSELDPLEYSRNCKTDDDSPEWQQRLHRDLTEEQREEAEAFFRIMSQCFETSGETCRCEDISITAFADKCSVIAPLAYACDVEDDDLACDKMDAIEDEEPIEDLLPDYLRDVLRALEDRFEDDKFDNHAPRECREAGATTRRECMKIMFRLDAPPECVAALERGEISLDNERDAREVCERIMFDLDAPFECKEAGLTDVRECGKLMFSLHAPQKCLDAGLTGEYRSDERKCREIAGEEFGDRRGPPRGEGPIVDFNCREIQNPEERLACYDKATSQADSRHGGFDDADYDGPCFTNEDWEAKKQECRNLYGEHAGDEPVYGNSGEGYECVIDAKCVNFGYKGEDNPWEGCEALYCGPGAYCEYGVCIPFEDYVAPGEGEPAYDCALLDCLPGSYCDPYRGCIPSEEPIPQPTFPEIVPPECGPGEFIECIGDVCSCVTEATPKPLPEEPTTTEPPQEPSTEPEPEPTPEPDTTNTGAIISGNAFLDYYFT